MSVASYNTQIRKGGVPVIVTDAPCEMLGNEGRIFRITNPARRLISPSYDIDVKNASDGTPVDYTTINLLEGVIVIVDAAEGEDGIEVDYRYIPTAYIGGAKEYSLELGGDLLDNTAFHSDTTQSAGNKTRQYGLTDITVSFSRWHDLATTLRDAKLNKETLLIEIRPGGPTSKLKASGWFVSENVNGSGEVAALEEESFTYMPGDPATLSDVHVNSIYKFSFANDWSTAETIDFTDQEIVDNYFPGLVLE